MYVMVEGCHSATEIDSTKVNPVVSKSVVFMNVDRTKKYFTQCATLRDSHGNSMCFHSLRRDY